MTRISILALTLSLIACSASEPAPSAPKPGAGSQERAGAGHEVSGPPVVGVSNVTLVNETELQLILAYAVPAGTESWGEDLLEGVVVLPGGATTLVLDPGVWELKCVLEDGAEIVFPPFEFEADDYFIPLAQTEEDDPSEDDEQEGGEPEDGEPEDEGN